MVSLKRNSKGELVEATGLRSRESSIYTPFQTEPFRLSRSKFNDFLSCQRCFYLDRVKGIVSPSMPGWTLNETTDVLLKKEFDVCREQQIPHRICEEAGLDHIVPFQHEDMDKWRNSLHGGLAHQIDGTNIILHGGVDDIWYDQQTEEVIVVDYKSQANKYRVEQESYLAGGYHQSYKIQLEVYAYLLTKMGFKVSPTGYFYVCNADRNADGFFGKMLFEETLVAYEWNSDSIEEKLFAMLKILNSDVIPEHNQSCENCAYSHQRARLENKKRIPPNRPPPPDHWP